MSNLKEITETVKLYKRKNKLKKLYLLQCISNYPAKIINQNLNVIPMFKKILIYHPVFLIIQEDISQVH